MWRPSLIIIVVVINYQQWCVNCLNCDSLLHSPEPIDNSTTNPVQFVPILDGADYKELISCLAMVGQAPMQQDQANNLWIALKKYFSRIDDIPVECYKFLGYGLAGIPVEDFQNITLDNIDIVEVFGKYRGLRQEQMAAIADGIIRDWSEKVPETLSEFDLIALGQILCHLNKSDISRIHPDAYKGAAEVIGELKDCNPEIVQAFGQLVVDPKAFGAPETWSQYDVAVLGIVINSLPPGAYAQIPEQFIKDMKKKKSAAGNDEKRAGGGE